MPADAVFFSRCRPQEADPISLVLRERRAFIGWPAWRHKTVPDRHRLADCLVDLWCSDDEWERYYAACGGERRHYKANRNFVRDVELGAIMLVPRPSLGVVYAGRVTRRFEIEGDPPWADDYLAIRRASGLEAEDEANHVSDVVQCRLVDEFRAISFPLFPAWMRRSLLGRSTFGRVKPMPEYGLFPFPVVDGLMRRPARPAFPWTRDPLEVGARLVDMVGPTAFEHLCVALLQLERPQEVWLHVGGSGDGGIDGIGANADGASVGLLQCKWAYWGGEVFGDSPPDVEPPMRVLASLLHGAARPGSPVEFWGRDRIVELVLAHAARLPLAVSLRISKPA